MKKLLFILLISTKFSFCQSDSAKTLVYFNEKDVVVYLNGQKIVSEQKMRKLAIGKYKVKAWAPHYKLFEDSFMVVGKGNKFYTKKLHFTEEYKAYRRKQNLFKLTYIVPACISVFNGINCYQAYDSRNKNIEMSYDIATDLKAQYDRGYTHRGPEYYAEKATYEELIRDQERIKKNGIILSSACMATAITCFIIDRVRKRKPFKETPLLTKINPSYNFFNNQICLFISL